MAQPQFTINLDLLQSLFQSGLLEGVIPKLYSVSNKVAPFIGLPLSECNTRGC